MRTGAWNFRTALEKLEEKAMELEREEQKNQDLKKTILKEAVADKNKYLHVAGIPIGADKRIIEVIVKFDF